MAKDKGMGMLPLVIIGGAVLWTMSRAKSAEAASAELPPATEAFEVSFPHPVIDALAQSNVPPITTMSTEEAKAQEAAVAAAIGLPPSTPAEEIAAATAMYDEGQRQAITMYQNYIAGNVSEVLIDLNMNPAYRNYPAYWTYDFKAFTTYRQFEEVLINNGSIQYNGAYYINMVPTPAQGYIVEDWAVNKMKILAMDIHSGIAALRYRGNGKQDKNLPTYEDYKRLYTMKPWSEVAAIAYADWSY
jgi:hypothetical protein